MSWAATCVLPLLRKSLGHRAGRRKDPVDREAQDTDGDRRAAPATSAPEEDEMGDKGPGSKSKDKKKKKKVSKGK